MKAVNNNNVVKKFGMHDIDWTRAQAKVHQQQVKIGVAYHNKDMGLVTQ
jgi:hypothetical protein